MHWWIKWDSAHGIKPSTNGSCYHCDHFFYVAPDYWWKVIWVLLKQQKLKQANFSSQLACKHQSYLRELLGSQAQKSRKMANFMSIHKTRWWQKNHNCHCYWVLSMCECLSTLQELSHLIFRVTLWVRGYLSHPFYKLENMFGDIK